MQSWQKLGVTVPALALAMAVVVQLLCPAGLLIAVATTGPVHSGCHDSAQEQSPQGPQQRCCAAGPSSQASPPVPYAPPAPALGEHFAHPEIAHTSSSGVAYPTVRDDKSPPGSAILRI